jgi:hypothetical protein
MPVPVQEARVLLRLSVSRDESYNRLIDKTTHAAAGSRCLEGFKAGLMWKSKELVWWGSLVEVELISVLISSKAATPARGQFR